MNNGNEDKRSIIEAEQAEEATASAETALSETESKNERIGSVQLLKPFTTVWSMIRSRGITKRWLVNTFAVVIVLLIGAVVALTFMLRSYYYNGIEQGLRQRSSVTVSYFKSTLRSGVNSGNSSEYFNAAQAFTEVFDSRDKMELQFLNASGDIIVSSSGFTSNNDRPLSDYYVAMRSQSGSGAWAGKNSNGEHVLAVTRLISASTGSSAGAVRYVVSLESVDDVLLSLSVIMIGVIIVIIFVMLFSGSYFVNSIVVPVKQITRSASRIARGDFDIRLESGFDDEIGSLVSAINSMASELADSEKMKNDFISTVSHELRTPLTAIKGWGETLRDCGSEDEQIFNKGMGIIISESERMCGLVEELLDFSSIQSGRMKLEQVRVELGSVVAQSVGLFTERCIHENKQLTLELPERSEDIFVNGDRSRLQQVFVNLIDNAIKYTESGGSITVRLYAESGEARLVISDTGCGISEEDLKRVTRRFYKANVVKRGFGIGLAVAEEITALHHGTLTVESKKNVGTTVTVRLPLMTEESEGLPDA